MIGTQRDILSLPRHLNDNNAFLLLAGFSRHLSADLDCISVSVYELSGGSKRPRSSRISSLQEISSGLPAIHISRRPCAKMTAA